MFRSLGRSIPVRFLSSTAPRVVPKSDEYVPPHQQPQTPDIHKLQEFVSRAKRLFIITGAGISTESGIPDYRSEGVGLYARTSNRPM